MMEVNKIQEEAEKELAEENSKKAKEKIKSLLKKKQQAELIVKNIEREIADAYAEIGRGDIT